MVPNFMLAVDHLTKRFGAQTVIDDLSFAMRAGERVTIFAPSSAGKTTLINVLTGLDHDYRGSVALAAQSPATIFQEPRLFPHMTVEENISLPLRIAGKPFAGPVQERYSRWLEVCELAPYARHYPYQLSGGMQQKVALIRGFLPEPDFVMLDEPFTSIDVRSKRAIIAYILETYPGITALFVTHAMDEIPLFTQSLLSFSTNRLAGFVVHDLRDASQPLTLEALYG